MKKLFLIALLFSCQKQIDTPLLTSNASKAQVAEVTTLLFNPCTGENMQLSGKLIYQIHDNVAEFHYAGVTGLGLTTGSIYHATANQIEVYNGGNITYIYRINFQTSGGANNLSQSLELHVNNGIVESLNFKDAYCQ